MATEEKTLTPEEQATENAEAFSAGFERVRGADPSEDEPAQPELREAAGGEDESPKEKDPEKGSGEEEVFAGLTASQLKGLLAKSAQVDDLQVQIRKAHGKIGELNSTLQTLSERKPEPATKVEADTGPSAEELETDYPDITRLADLRARKIVDEAMKGHKPSDPIDAAAMAADVETRVQYEVNRTLMSYAHPDWEDVIGTDDYKVWLATQPQETQERATTTPRATELSGIVASFKTWKGGADDKAQRSRSRLEAGLTPKGVAGGAGQVTPSELDEFHAGFKSVRGS